MRAKAPQKNRHRKSGRNNGPVILLFYRSYNCIYCRHFFLENQSKAASVLDLTNKIKQKQAADAQAKAAADKAVQEYQDALKEFDPDFHNDDGGDGKPSA